MRIVGGEYRGQALTALGKGDVAAHLRPTADRVRESLFNMLSGGRFGDPVSGAYVLDLFAGTGALGLEALSRGAIHATFVDSGRKAQGLIHRNISKLHCGDRARLISADAGRLPKNNKEACTLIFLDPPYGRDLGGKALSCALIGGWIAESALVVWEEVRPQDPPDGFRILDQRRYGDTFITIMERV